MGKYAEKIVAEHKRHHLTAEQIRHNKCQRTKARNAARKQENLEKMAKCTPRLWNREPKDLSYNAAVKKRNEHAKDGKETRLVRRTNGKFTVKFREG